MTQMDDQKTEHRKWCIGERHPEYGVVQAMGITGGEAYRWFMADDGVVTMIPLSMLGGVPGPAVLNNFSEE